MLVHRELGPGFLETAYRNALCVELRLREIPFELERTIAVKYRNEPVAVQRMDLVVDAAAVVELKAVETLNAVHQAQLMSYMRAAGIRAGLLMNFGGLTLKQGLRRIVI
ncbi:MAG: GxxExxY protein [Acidobacteria bacterium]|nr:GxxExxY protein [Acidobacteriota bacterium]